MNVETVDLPAMWWIGKGEWPVHGLIWWRERGPCPMLEIRAESYAVMQDALASFGMTLDLPEDEIAKGFGPEPVPDEPMGDRFYRTSQPTVYHWTRRTETSRADLFAPVSQWDEFCEFLETHLDIDAPTRDAFRKTKKP